MRVVTSRDERWVAWCRGVSSWEWKESERAESERERVCVVDERKKGQKANVWRRGVYVWGSFSTFRR